MKNFKLFQKLLVLAIVLLTWNAHAYAWNMLYLASSNNSWSTSADPLNNTSNGKGVLYVYTPENMTFKIVNAYNTTWLGRDDGDKLKPGDDGFNFDKAKSSNCTYNGDAGVVGFNCDQTGSNADDWPWIWLTRPTVYIYHKWNNSSSSTVAMTDNNDGTYTYTGYYSKTTSKILVGPANASAHSNVFKEFGSYSACTLVGSPVDCDKCIFEWNSSGYRGSTSYSSNKGTMTVTKLCSLTYNSNGADDGSVPTGVADRKYGTSITIADNTGSLVKSGCVFVGWNTSADGSGTFYLPGSSLSLSAASATLYAQWLTIHEPGLYETAAVSGGYGQSSLYTTGGRNDEVYQYASANSKVFVYAGTSTTTANAANCMLDYAINGGNARKGWMLHSGGVKEVSGYTTHSGEFQTNASELHYLAGNTHIIAVTGFDQFSLYGCDKTKGTYEMQIYINGTKKTLGSTSYTIGRWDLDPTTTSIIRITATGSASNYSKDAGFSLHVPSSYSLTVAAGTHVGTVTGSTDPVTLGNSYSISASNFDTGYEFNNWTASPAANASFTSSTSASTSVTVSNGSVTVTANAREKMTTVTINANPAGAGTFTVDASAFTPGNTTTAGVATSRTVVATPTSGKVFHNWTVGGNATGSASTNTYTLEGNGSAGTGTLTANFGIASGWYMEGEDFGGWSRPTTYQLSYPYRGMSGVYYYPTTLTKDHWWKVNNNNIPYNATNASTTIAKGTLYNLVEEYTNSSKVSATMSNVWVVVNTNNTKKIWVQDPQTFHNVNVTGADNAKGPVKVTLKTTSAFTKGDNVFETTQFANGETFTVTVTGVTGYIPTITIGDNTPVTWWKEQATYTADGTMSTSDITVTISYTPTRAVRFAKTTGCKTLTATGPESTSVSDNTKIKDGTEITFSQENSDGYTFSKWYSNNTGTSGTKYSDEDDDYTLTVSSMAYTIYPIYTANKYTITLDNQCAYSPGTHEDGSATEFEATYGTPYFTHNMVTPPSAYSLYTFGGWYSEVGGAGDQIITDLGALVDGSSVYTTSGNWTHDDDVTVYAKWSCTLGSVGADKISPNGGSGGSIALIYNSSVVSGFTPSTRTGYIFQGYYNAADGGDKIVNVNGTLVDGDVIGYLDDGKWIYNSASSLTLYAHWTPITYTISFDKNDDPSFLGSDVGDDPDDIAATYAVSYTIPACPYTRAGYTFNGWSTAEHKAKGSVPVTDYDYRGNYPASNLTTTQGATVTLYPKWTGNSYTVSLNARGGSVYPTSIDVRYGEKYGTGYYGDELPEPLAPTGKEFIGWYTSPTGGTLVTKDTQMSTIGAHTLYARYSDIAMVYFKNTIGWENVFVTYDAYWDNTNGTGNNGKIYHKMTQIYGTNIYYDQIPATILASWKGDIAFNSEELLTGDKHAPQDEGNYGNYNKGEVVFRHDFDSRATMFVPKDVNTNNTDGNYQKNSAQYISTGYKDGTTSDPEYTSGYWMKYNDTYSGYLFSYQKALSGSWSSEYKMNTSVKGDTIFVYTMAMDANTRYDLRIRKDCQTTNTKSRQFRYGTQITSAACTDLKLVCDPSNNSWMQTTVAGEYKFILTCKKDGHMYLTVEYPLAVNDYQVLYGWNDGSAKTYASEVIKAHPDTVDTISVFVHKLYTPVVSRSMKIQKCTGITSGVPTWTDVTGGGIDLMDVTANGVYNFEITQPESGDPTGAFAGKYEGDYYIRTTCSDGGWDQYKDREENIMTYSAYSMTQTLSAPYSHYYCHYIGSTSTDITFAVATKYSPNISGTMIGDATIGNAATTLPANANVRFSWNEETNAMARAYIKDAQGPSNARFLVMHGAGDDMIFNPNGSDIGASGSLAANELQFDDKGDWVYQVMLQAKPGAQVSIIAKYGSGEGVDRYLVGGPSSFETIMGGEGSNKYTIMAIYDFKTNRLMNAWTPEGDITDALSDIDMLWIRYRQNSAQQITFNGGSLSNVKAVGAIELRYNDLVGHVASWTYETRPLLRYFISFPFDVNVSDIFGLHGAELGREFVIRKYDGAERAKNGLFLGDGDTYWVDLTMDSVMHANEGYSLVFDNEYLNGDLGSIWENKTGGSSVYLYFPAAAEIASISDVNKGTTLAEHVCQNTKTYTYGGVQVSHTNSDSHWNLIGSPLFVDSYVYSSSGTNGQAGDKARTTLDSYYAYNVEFNYWEPELYYKAGEYYTCHAMHAMLVQFAGNVTWSKNAPAAPAGVAARERQEATVTNNLITLNLLQNGEESDHTYIKMDENGNSDFMLCEDMYKIINKSKPNIFTYAGDNCVAYNKVAIESQTINVGVEIRKNGTYTFEMPENVAGQVTLIDTFDGTRTNLNLEDYEIYLNRGSYYDRFLIEINPNNAPTAIDGVTDGSGSLKDGKAHKFIMNDMMYILKDGVLYDATGKRVE